MKERRPSEGEALRGVAGHGLSDRLLDSAIPLTQAFDTRCRALAPCEALDIPTEMLLATLMQCVAAGDDVEAIVKLSSETVARHGHARTMTETYRNAVQALDWAIRDLQLEQYTAVERERFSTSTALFVELIRRASGEGNRNQNQPTMQSSIEALRHADS